jgi:hypothetical protein
MCQLIQMDTCLLSSKFHNYEEVFYFMLLGFRKQALPAFPTRLLRAMQTEHRIQMPHFRCALAYTSKQLLAL